MRHFTLNSVVSVGVAAEHSLDASVAIYLVELTLESVKKVETMDSSSGHKGDLHIRSLNCDINKAKVAKSTFVNIVLN